jgi:hypothetical protein
MVRSKADAVRRPDFLDTLNRRQLEEVYRILTGMDYVAEDSDVSNRTLGRKRWTENF